MTGKEKALLLFPLSKMCPQLATMRTYPLNVTSSRMAPPCDHPVETAPTFPAELFRSPLPGCSSPHCHHAECPIAPLRLHIGPVSISLIKCKPGEAGAPTLVGSACLLLLTLGLRKYVPSKWMNLGYSVLFETGSLVDKAGLKLPS